jgi:hypothetical protein
VKYATEMGSGAMMYIPSFIQTGSGIQKLIRGIHRHTHRQHGDLTILLLSFQRKEIRLKYLITSATCKLLERQQHLH